MNLFTGRQARPQASMNSLKWLWISCQILLLSSFALLSGCDGGDSSSSTTPASSTSTTTDTTQTSADTVDETPVYEGFKYLNTAKGVDPRQQEATLLKIKGIDTAECDGYECDFTFGGRKAVFVYPPKNPAGASSLSISSVNQNLDATVVFTKKFASQNTLSALANTPACPTKTTALILAPAINTFFDEETHEVEKAYNENMEYFISQYIDQLKSLGYENIVVKKGAEANHIAFQDELSKEIYSMIIILTHGSKDGWLLTNDLIRGTSWTGGLFGYSYQYPDDVKKDGKLSELYVDFGVHNQPNDQTFIGINLEWWKSKDIAAVSANRFYMFGACEVFNEKSPLLNYFSDNKLNGVGFRYSVSSLFLPYFSSFLQESSSKTVVDALNTAASGYSSKIWLNGPLLYDKVGITNPDKKDKNGDYIYDADFPESMRLELGTLTHVSPKVCSTTVVTPTPPVTPPPVSTNGAPVVSNFIVPSFAKINEWFTMQISYSDPNGNNDVVQAVIQADDDYPLLHPYPITNGIGLYQMKGKFESTGQHWLNVYVVDSVGNKSNEMRQNITVTSDTPNPAPTPSDNTSLNGTYSGTKIYTSGAEAGTTYNITISSLSETSTMLSGTYTVSGFGSSSLSGMRTGNSVTLRTNPAGNPTCTHTLTGTISGNTISGTMTTANNCNGSGTWTVTK